MLDSNLYLISVMEFLRRSRVSVCNAPKGKKLGVRK